MVQDFLFVVVGLTGLVLGSNWLIKGAARLANSFGLPALMIGLTVVAYGTSAPELIVSLTAALQGESDIAVGNVVGSNISNIGLILGLTGLILPIAVHEQLIRREIPFLVAISILGYFFASDGELSRLEGLILLTGTLAFTIVSYILATQAKQTFQDEALEFEEAAGLIEPHINRLLEGGRVVAGIVVLVVGAQLTVEGATGVAREVGISDVIIALTLVSVGTSLPELATSLVAALRKETDIFVGNIVGSNIFNLLFILGTTAAVKPIEVADEVIRWDYPLMLGFTLFLLLVTFSLTIRRWEAALLLCAYGGYVAFLFIR